LSSAWMDEGISLTSLCYSFFVTCCAGPLLLALLHDLAHHRRHEVRWDRKTNAIGGGVRLSIDGPQCRDANEFSLQIDQSAAAVAGINGGIGLDGVGNCGSRRLCDAAVQRADDAVGGCLGDAKRVANCQDLLPHSEF
jgi:hypothetical protein